MWSVIIFGAKLGQKVKQFLYDAILTEKPSRVARTPVLDWFGSRFEFKDSHSTAVDETIIDLTGF